MTNNCDSSQQRDFDENDFFDYSLGGSIFHIAIPVRNFARTILMIWLLSTLILRNAYQGKLYDNLRGNQRNQPYYSLNSLFESNLRLYLYESFYEDFISYAADNIPNHYNGR